MMLLLWAVSGLIAHAFHSNTRAVHGGASGGDTGCSSPRNYRQEADRADKIGIPLSLVVGCGDVCRDGRSIVVVASFKLDVVC